MTIRARIAGVGKYLPERVVTNSDLERLVETSDSWIQDRTGVRERRMAADNETASTMGIEAARAALAQAEIDPDDLDLIIAATTTPDGMFPAIASLVQEGLGARRAGAFDINAACVGFLSALATGAQFIASGACRRVLVTGSAGQSDEEERARDRRLSPPARQEHADAGAGAAEGEQRPEVRPAERGRDDAGQPGEGEAEQRHGGETVIEPLILSKTGWGRTRRPTSSCVEAKGPSRRRESMIRRA